MDEQVLRALMDLVGIRSVRYEQEAYDAAVEYILSLIDRWLPDADVEVIPKDSDYKGIHRKVKNILAYVDAGSDETVALVSHYDVVDAKGPRKIKVGETEIEFDPFKPTIIENRLYGRGSADDKSAVVASIYATQKARDSLSKNVLLVIVGDEEIGGEAGIKAVADKVIDLATEVIVIDGMYKVVANGASGVIHAEFSVRGDQGHAGMPFYYRNSVNALIRILNTLLNYNAFGAYSELPARGDFATVADRLTITGLKAGLESANIIPPKASARIDYRYVAKQPKEAEDMLKRLIIGSAMSVGLSKEDIEIRILGNHPSRYVPKEHPFVQRFKEIAEKVTGDKHEIGVERGGNDGFVFANRGIPTITYGAMCKDSNIHGPLENLRLDIFEKLIAVLEAYLG